MKVYLIDIDGTLANLDHRILHIKRDKPDWPAFYAACDQDKPIPHMIELVDQICRNNDVLFVTGRSEEVRWKTLEWLRIQFGTWIFNEDIFMRKEGDHRPDYEVKSELVDEIIAKGWQPVLAFEDRKQCVDFYRARGIPCVQVAEGNF